jgi:hypothetical protein
VQLFKVVCDSERVLLPERSDLIGGWEGGEEERKRRRRRRRSSAHTELQLSHDPKGINILLECNLPTGIQYYL